MLFRLKCLPVLEITLDETNRFECLIIGLRPLIATERIMTLVVFQALQLRRCENRTFKLLPFSSKRKPCGAGMRRGGLLEGVRAGGSFLRPSCSGKPSGCPKRPMCVPASFSARWVQFCKVDSAQTLSLAGVPFRGPGGNMHAVQRDSAPAYELGASGVPWEPRL
jgi:hypothetical protein